MNFDDEYKKMLDQQLDYILLPIYGDSVRTEGTRNWGGESKKETPAEDPRKYIGNDKKFICKPEIILKSINQLGLRILETFCSHAFALTDYHTRVIHAASYMKVIGDEKNINDLYNIATMDENITNEALNVDEIIFALTKSEGDGEFSIIEKNKKYIKPFTSIEQMVKDFDSYVQILKSEYKPKKQEPSEDFWDRKIHQTVQMDKIKNKKWDGD